MILENQNTKEEDFMETEFNRFPAGMGYERESVDQYLADIKEKQAGLDRDNLFLKQKLIDCAKLIKRQNSQIEKFQAKINSMSEVKAQPPTTRNSEQDELNEAVEIIVDARKLADEIIEKAKLNAQEIINAAFIEKKEIKQTFYAQFEDILKDANQVEKLITQSKQYHEMIYDKVDHISSIFASLSDDTISE